MEGLLILLGAAVFSAVFTYGVNWLALMPWRRSRNLHWSARARAYHPARVAAASNLWVFPAVMTIAVKLLWPDSSLHWFLVAAVTSMATLAATIPTDYEVFRRCPLQRQFQRAMMFWLIRFSLWLVFLGAIALMPEQFNLWAATIGLLVVAFLVCWSAFGWLTLGRVFKWVAPAPPRLQTIVQAVAGRMNVSVRGIYLLRDFTAQAFALPATRRTLFTERLLEILTDAELAAVAAHELAHLTESRRQYLRRYLGWLVLLPWVYIKPVLHLWNFNGFCLLLILTALIPMLARRVSHKLELRADAMARNDEMDEGSYARALAKIYEDNLLPAVNARGRATHPHLYDRMIAAGVTPDFPRPAPARSTSWNGMIMSIAFGILLVLLLTRFMEQLR